MSPRRPDDEPAGPPPEWADFVVPDDLSELDAESRAVRTELLGRRKGHLGRMLAVRRWRGHEVSGYVLLGVLIVALFFASLGMFLQPGPPRTPAPRALAHPTGAPGAAEALLPDLALVVGRSASVRLRNVRPAVVAVLPDGCDCSALISDVIAATAASRLRVLVVGQRSTPALPSSTPRSRVTAGADPGGRLASTYQAAATPLLLFVRSDGTVSRVMDNAVPGAELRQEVAGLAH